jgi:hypothetical protein
MCWEFAGYEEEPPEDTTEPVLTAVAEFVHTQGSWKGSAQSLVEELQKQNPNLRVWPNTLSRRLKANAKLLQESFGVLLTQSRTQQGKYIELKPVTDMVDMSDD